MSRRDGAVGLVFSSSRLLVISSRLLVIVALFATVARAQTGIESAGAPVLLLPLGARIAASGQTVASPDVGSEQLYWNPSGVARATTREIAFHNGGFFIGPLNAVATVFPLGRAGVVGGAIAVLDYGSQETGDGGGATGTISQQSYIFSATYAATLGARASVGVSYKYVLFIGTCAGLCPPVAVFDVSTSAVDLGMQYRVLKDDDLVIGAALRHAGQRFQVNDEPQADPLPTRMQLGASYRLRALDADMPGAVLRINGDVIDRALHPGSAAIRLGADLEYKKQVSVRVGYVAGTGDGTGIAVGLGLTVGRVQGDIARSISGASDAAAGATNVSLRYQW